MVYNKCSGQIRMPWFWPKKSFKKSQKILSLHLPLNIELLYSATSHENLIGSWPIYLAWNYSQLSAVFIQFHRKNGHSLYISSSENARHEQIPNKSPVLCVTWIFFLWLVSSEMFPISAYKRERSSNVIFIKTLKLTFNSPSIETYNYYRHY